MKITDIKSSLLDLARCHSCGVRESALCSGLNDDEFGNINFSVEDVKVSAGAFLFHHRSPVLFYCSTARPCFFIASPLASAFSLFHHKPMVFWAVWAYHSIRFLVVCWI